MGFLLPGFHIVGFLNALIAAVVIAIVGWIAESLFGHRVSQYRRGIIGFIVSAVVIYVAQFVVPTMRVSVVGALLAAVIIGIIDGFVPTELR